MYSFASDEYIEQTVKNYSPSMLKAAYTLLKSTSDAEDAVQDAFVAFITKAPDFKNEEHKKAWLLRVTINISKNMLKAGWRNKFYVSEEISVSDKTDDVLPYVLDLDEKYRIVVHLYYYEGYSLKEIANILKLPLATVGTRLSRGRKILEVELKEDFEV